MGGQVIWPYSDERSIAVSGTLLDERTQTPVSGADVFFAADPKLHTKSDKDGRFGISATRYHYWVSYATLGGESRQWNPPLAPEIMITHTNWATRLIEWDKSPQTILLKKLPEPVAVRPWMTFDAKGFVLQDGGAVRYLASRPVQTSPGFARGSIYFGPYDGGTLCVINVNFKEKVYDPHLIVLQGSNKPSCPATTPTGFSVSFWPHYDSPTNQIRIKDTSYVYQLEFIR